MRRRGLAAVIARAAALVLVSSLPAGAQQAPEPEADLALVLAIDCSFSVDASEYALQMRGLGRALQDKEVWDAIRRGRTGRIAIAAFQWSDSNYQETVLPWTVIDSEAASQAVGQKLAAMPRKLAEGGTSIANALTYARRLFASAPSAFRRVVDVSTDGRNNVGPALPPVRDALVADGITINALAITNEFPTLHFYAGKQVIGGAGSFVQRAQTYDDYESAILQKLVREIAGPGVT